MFDPELWERTSEDGNPNTGQFPGNAAYIGGYVDGEIIGLFVLHDSRLGYEAHFQVLKPYRKYARAFIRQALDICDCRVVVEIPDIYPEVINFAVKSGFKTIGINPESFKKHGKLHDQHIMEHMK